MRVRTTVGGFPQRVDPQPERITIDSDPTVTPSVAIDVFHDDPGEFLTAHEQSGLLAEPFTVPAPDGNVRVAMFSVQSGPVRIVHWDAAKYATEDEFETAWKERVLDG